MQTYGDIIARMKEIIEMSKQRMLEFPSIDSQTYKENFVRMLWRDIDISFADEFQNLLDAERTFYLIQTNKKAAAKNTDLIDLCKDQTSKSNNHANDYLKLLEILNNSFDRYPYELTEYYGYFVCKEELPMFIATCRKLNVGPYIKLRDLSQEEAKKEVNNNFKAKKEQGQRLKEYLGTHQEVVIPLQLPDEDDAEIEEELPSNLNDNFNEIIYLGIMGKLTKDMVMEFTNLYSSLEFDELLIELEKWRIFSKKEILEMRRWSRAHITPINNIDKLVEFLVDKEGLNPYALKAFIPTIGYYNYQYMLDQLFKLGAIEFEDYMKSIEELINDKPRRN